MAFVHSPLLIQNQCQAFPHFFSLSISPQLRSRLANYSCDKRYLFPGRHGLGHMSRGAADQILREACDLIGLKGVSTHSFRRTALTKMHNEGIPLRVIQRISGHKTLQALQRYLEVGEEQVESAIAALNFQIQ